MSDEGFHGGDLFTMTADGRDVTNRTSSRKASVNSFFWQTPDRILLVEYVGGGSAISELSLTNNSARTIWKGPEGIHAFGNFPDFALSKDGKVAAAELSSYNSPPEVFVGPLGEWSQLTNNNAGLEANWGKAESIEWTNEGSNIQGWLVPPAKVESRQKISNGRAYPRRTIQRDDIGVAGIVWNVACDHRCAFHARLLRAASQSARQLRPG